jgi:TRAP-type C4-dicarboxylate transport system substrate-binding protein
MKKKILIKSLFLFLALFLIQSVNLVLAAEQMQKVEWKIQSIYPSGRALQCLMAIAKRVEGKTGGNFQLKIFMPGQLVGAREIFTAVNKGMLEGGYATMTYYSGTIPVADAKYGPHLALDDREIVYLQLESDYLKPIRKECAKNNIFFVGSIPSQPGNLCSRKIVKTLADVKGLKIRGGGIWGDIATAWGGVPVSIAPAEMYTALQRGTMDAVFYPLYAAVDYKFYEQIKCVVWPAPVETFADFFLNMEAYNRLPSAWQKVLIDSFIEKIKEAAETGDAYTKEQEKFLKDHGVEIITWPETDVNMAKKLCIPIREKYIAASPASAEVVTIAEKALEEYRKKRSGK